MSKKREYVGRFRHYRPRFEEGRVDGKGQLLDGRIDNMGGATLSYAELDGKIFAALSFCSPNDNFQFQYGRNKADGRLAQLMRKPEIADDDLFFVREESLADFFRVFDTYMADDLEYHRNGKQEIAEEARPQAAAA